MVDSSYNIWRPIIASILIITFAFTLLFGYPNDGDSNIPTLNTASNFTSNEEIDLSMKFENETNFIFQIPVIYISDSSQGTLTRVSPAFADLKLVEEKSDYADVSISFLSNSINGTLIEYFQINGTATTLSFYSKLSLDSSELKPNFTNLLISPIYLFTSDNSSMSFSLFYLSKHGVGPTTGGEILANLFKNVTIENGWKMYETGDITLITH